MNKKAFKMLGLMVIALMIALPSQAQEKSKDKKKEKEVIIIKKKKSDNDDVVTIEQVSKDKKVIVKIIEDGKVKTYEANSFEELPDETKERLEDVNDISRINITTDKIEVLEFDDTDNLPDGVKEKRYKMEIIIDSDDEKMDFDFDGDNTFFTETTNRPMLGVLIEDDDSEENGVKLSGVSDDSGAKKAGLQKGDVITKVAGKEVNSVKEIREALEGKKGDDVVTVNYTRDGEAREADVTLKSGSVNVFEGKQKNFWHENRPDGDKKVIIIREGKKDNKANIIEEVIVEGREKDFNLELNVYPNPTGNQVTVEFESAAKPTSVSLLDVTGKQIYHKELKNFNGTFNENIDVSNSTQGILILTIIQGENVHTEKIMKR